MRESSSHEGGAYYIRSAEESLTMTQGGAELADRLKDVHRAAIEVRDSKLRSTTEPADQQIQAFEE